VRLQDDLPAALPLPSVVAMPSRSQVPSGTGVTHAETLSAGAFRLRRAGRRAHAGVSHAWRFPGDRAPMEHGNVHSVRRTGRGFRGLSRPAVAQLFSGTEPWSNGRYGGRTQYEAFCSTQVGLGQQRHKSSLRCFDVSAPGQKEIRGVQCDRSIPTSGATPGRHDFAAFCDHELQSLINMSGSPMKSTWLRRLVLGGHASRAEVIDAGHMRKYLAAQRDHGRWAESEALAPRRAPL